MSRPNMRRLGVAAVSIALLVALVAAVYYAGPSATEPLQLSSSGQSAAILARAESEARNARALAHGSHATKDGRSERGDKTGAAKAPKTSSASDRQKLRNELKDMEDIRKIRTYSGGGSKIIAEAKREERRLKKLELKQEHAKAKEQQLAAKEAVLKAKEGETPKDSEHALAREEELSDCEPFCHMSASSEARNSAHTLLKKKQARERMQHRAELRLAREKEAAEERAHCIFCAHKEAAHDRSLSAKPGLGANLLKDSDMDVKTGRLHLPSLHAAQRAGHANAVAEAANTPRTLTVEDEDKINSAANTIALAMRGPEVDSKDVDREMMKMSASGTSWKALWGSGLKHSDLSSSEKSRFEYLAGRPVGHGDRLDNPLSAKTAANPFGDDFHY